MFNQSNLPMKSLTSLQLNINPVDGEPLHDQ
jgi:hypothetical protein